MREYNNKNKKILKKEIAIRKTTSITHINNETTTPQQQQPKPHKIQNQE